MYAMRLYAMHLYAMYLNAMRLYAMRLYAMRLYASHPNEMRLNEMQCKAEFYEHSYSCSFREKLSHVNFVLGNVFIVCLTLDYQIFDVFSSVYFLHKCIM